jgi:hypothetical protein
MDDWQDIVARLTGRDPPGRPRPAPKPVVTVHFGSGKSIHFLRYADGSYESFTVEPFDFPEFKELAGETPTRPLNDFNEIYAPISTTPYPPADRVSGES